VISLPTTRYRADLGGSRVEGSDFATRYPLPGGQTGVSPGSWGRFRWDLGQVEAGRVPGSDGTWARFGQDLGQVRIGLGPGSDRIWARFGSDLGQVPIRTGLGPGSDRTWANTSKRDRIDCNLDAKKGAIMKQHAKQHRAKLASHVSAICHSNEKLEKGGHHSGTT
jgi:hypothetical protein